MLDGCLNASIVFSVSCLFLLSQPQQVFCPWRSSFDVGSFKEKLQESRVADTVINRCPDRSDVFRVRASRDELSHVNAS
jgi:hypothetical protein